VANQIAKKLTFENVCMLKMESFILITDISLNLNFGGMKKKKKKKKAFDMDEVGDALPVSILYYLFIFFYTTDVFIISKYKDQLRYRHMYA
jgi:hypothetical protein